MDAPTSRVVSFLRFPLIFAVIFIHCNLLVKNPELESMPVFYFLVYITMKLVCIAVPLFFFISGLLFFKEGYFDFTLYKKKLKSRVRTVLIPYLLWNIIYFAILGIMQVIKPDTLVILHKHIADFRWQDFLWIFWDISKITGLADDQRACLVGAFWFLQCLFVLFLMSPIIYYLIKSIRHFTLLIIGILYFTDFIPEMPGIQCNAIVYYMFGAYLSITGIDFISILKRIPVQAYIIMMIGALFVSYLMNENNIVYNITDLFIQAAVFAITVYMIENNHWKESQYLVSSVFFVFAVHRLFSAALMTVSVYVIPSIGNEVFLYLYYILMVLLTIIASLSVYQISKRYLPRITNILNGGR
ncbi:MAG: acyltransferase family protein [Bacteroidaceae bacterium]|nr:acyltransferase family protein [Bacteroidaceae bacterium]